LKTYQINIRPTAESDILERYEQIYSESPENAQAWYKDLITAIKSLQHLAQRCPIADEDAEFNLGIRHLIVGRYRVLYFLQGTTVEVLHIRHERHSRRL